ncbi:unnamed protein product [Trypanosoma congolense IL3000]|uniref:WGS project CAEQ00000000 data, annotated contig 1363 n=1 Tax=Trypanosoma congolense (strain IL3000) TaxID=1068625 RepID=F9W5R6_TRYCI|nr:unnamed protein product [Trypanosoma congolense IL3000]
MVLKLALVSDALIDSLLLDVVRRAGLGTNLTRFALARPKLSRIWERLEPLLHEEEAGDSNTYAKRGIMMMFSSCMRDISDQSLPYLRKVCEEGGSAARSAISALLKYFPAEAMEILPGLLEREPKIICQQEVYDVVGNNLQGEMLEKILSVESIKGTFLNEGSLPDRFRGHSWTFAKQQKYADSILKLVETNGKRWWSLLFLTKPLDSLYSVNLADMFCAVISEDSEPTALRDCFINLLGRGENPDSLQALLETLDDSRAPVGICAIQKRAASIPTSQLLQIVDRAMQSPKVTVQKEALRLCALRDSDATFDFLKRLHTEKKMHVDVEIAWIHALFSFLNKREVWEYLHFAAKKRKALALAAMEVPYGALEEQWQREAFSKLFVPLVTHAENFVVVRALERLAERALPAYDPELIKCLFNLLLTERRPEYFPNTLRALVISTADAHEIARCLVSVKHDGLLSENVRVHCSNISSLVCRFRPIATAMVDTLIDEGRQPAIVCKLLCWLPPTVAGEYLEKLLVKGLFHVGCATEVMKGVSNFGCDMSGAEALEERLRGHENPLMQRIGLEMLQWLGENAKWGEKHRRALSEYCNASDPWVGDTAKTVMP